MTGSRILLALSSCLALLPPAAQAEAPASLDADDVLCGGIVLRDGTVSTGRPLPVSETPLEVDPECVRAVCETLADYLGLRTVTVVVKLPPSQRAGGAAQAIGAAYREALVSAGLTDPQISVVAPGIQHGEERLVALTFTEKRGHTLIAVVEAASGPVHAGASRTALVPSRRGATYPPHTYVGTGDGGSARVVLADGSRLQLGAKSLVLLGALYLGEDGGRVVELRLAEGAVEARAPAGDASSQFDIGARSAVGAGKGATFRLRAGGESGTGLEAVAGDVVLRTGKAELVVREGEGALIDPHGGSLPVRRALPPAPTVTGPVEGSIDPDEELSWTPVLGAESYRVALARDASFTHGARTVEADGTSLELAGRLPPGKWYWRVTAVDEDGFLGVPSRTYAFSLAGSR